MKTAIISGVTGQDGSYLAELLLAKEYRVVGLKRRTSIINTTRIDHLLSNQNFILEYYDLRDHTSPVHLLQRYALDGDCEVYHLAAQSHVQVSFSVPADTVNGIVDSTLAWLEAIRITAPSARFYHASSSEMFGNSPDRPYSEKSRMEPVSPYACAKLCAHNLVKTYRQAYGLFACNGILFNHETNTSATPVLIRRDGKLEVVPLDELAPTMTHNMESDGRWRSDVIAPKGIEIWDNGRWSKITAISRYRQRQKPIRRILSRSGFVEVTLDHKLHLVEESLLAKDIKCHDRVAEVSLPEISSDREQLKDDLAWVLGFFVGDGSLHGGSTRTRGQLDFFNSSPERLEEVRRRILKLDEAADFALLPHESSYKPGKFNWKLRVKSDQLKQFAAECYWETKPKALKRVPQRVLNATVESIESFLDGYAEADGTKSLTKYKLQYYTTKSQVLATGLRLLCHWTGRDVTNLCEQRVTPTAERFYHKGFIRSQRALGCDGQRGLSGHNLMKDRQEITKIWDGAEDEFVTITTDSGTFSAGTGLLWIYNSPRRGETFVTRKITIAAARIKLGLQESLELGNLDASRDWGFAGDYVRAMWQILQTQSSSDYVVATGETHTVREFLETVWDIADLGDWAKHVRLSNRLCRPNEVDYLLGNPSKACSEIGWQPIVSFRDLAEIMFRADLRKASEQ